MIYPASSEPLTKVTLNLFSSDLEWLKAKYGHGFTTEIRKIVREAVREHEETYGEFE